MGEARLAGDSPVAQDYDNLCSEAAKLGFTKIYAQEFPAWQLEGISHWGHDIEMLKHFLKEASNQNLEALAKIPVR